MQLQILQEDLTKGLTLASRMTASRGQLPILANVLLFASKDGLQISATNLEIGVRISLGGKVSAEGSTTVVAKSLAEFINSLSAGPLTLESQGDKLKVSTTKSSAVFSGIPATEFPVLPSADETKKSLTLTLPEVNKIATSVAFAAASDESRPILTGIQFKTVPDGLSVIATDGFRMSRLQIHSTKFIAQSSLILPSRTILELAKILTQSEQKSVDLQIIPESNQVIFSIGEIDLVSRILEGTFPDINKIIPTNSTSNVTVDREDLLRSVRTTSIFARENSNIIKFKIQDSNIKITAAAASLGENESEVETEIEGEGGDISFNCKFMLDFLNSVNSERIVLKMSGATAPGIFMAEGDEELIHLIMPVRV